MVKKESFGRSVEVSLKIEYSLASKDAVSFRREYDALSEIDDDPVGHWLKIAKARGETKDSDRVLINLLVELHRKVDNLTKIVNNEVQEFLPLDTSEFLRAVGHGFFIAQNDIFTPQSEYYGRINLPVFPERKVAFYFTALDKNTAKITIMHDRDIKDWDGYIAARERALIREKKGI